ncbi:helix-turn-helix domain-containing protein [Metapseudomonas resinovorans]|uniref:hypothetical protein n=1 Tax=Metapseudomonas resinovorans TaxID=53412 RepID=UPI0004139A74|nr:hypothetical protein [Pseudomonas resinovorans]
MDECSDQTLAAFAEGKTQPEVAGLIRVTQSAVSQMMKSGRDIRVRKLTEGGYEAYEIRPIGGRRKKVA